MDLPARMQRLHRSAVMTILDILLGFALGLTPFLIFVAVTS